MDLKTNGMCPSGIYDFMEDNHTFVMFNILVLLKNTCMYTVFRKSSMFSIQFDMWNVLLPMKKQQLHVIVLHIKPYSSHILPRLLFYTFDNHMSMSKWRYNVRLLHTLSYNQIEINYPFLSFSVFISYIF